MEPLFSLEMWMALKRRKELKHSRLEGRLLITSINPKKIYKVCQYLKMIMIALYRSINAYSMYTVNVSKMQISTKVCQLHTLSALLFNSWQLSASNLIWVCFCVFSEELRRMQEQMQRLQQQLEASQKSSSATSTPNSIPGTKAPSKANTPSQGPPKQSSSKPVRPTQKTKPQAGITLMFFFSPGSYIEFQNVFSSKSRLTIQEHSGDSMSCKEHLCQVK